MQRSWGTPALRFNGDLHLDGAALGVDDAAKLDERPIAACV